MKLATTLMAVCLTGIAACTSGGHIATQTYGTTHDGEVVPLERILHNNGGSARDVYQLFVERQKRHGHEGYVIDGPCVSACAYYALYSKRTCYTRHGSLGLHLATHWLRGRTAEVEAYNEKVLAYLPKPIAKELRRIDNATALTGKDVRFEWLKKNWPEGYCGTRYARIGM